MGRRPAGERSAARAGERSAARKRPQRRTTPRTTPMRRPKWRRAPPSWKRVSQAEEKAGLLPQGARRGPARRNLGRAGPRRSGSARSLHRAGTGLDGAPSRGPGARGQRSVKLPSCSEFSRKAAGEVRHPVELKTMRWWPTSGSSRPTRAAFLQVVGAQHPLIRCAEVLERGADSARPPSTCDDESGQRVRYSSRKRRGPGSSLRVRLGAALIVALAGVVAAPRRGYGCRGNFGISDAWPAPTTRARADR